MKSSLKVFMCDIISGCAEALRVPDAVVSQDVLADCQDVGGRQTAEVRRQQWRKVRVEEDRAQSVPAGIVTEVRRWLDVTGVDQLRGQAGVVKNTGRQLSFDCCRGMPVGGDVVHAFIVAKSISETLCQVTATNKIGCGVRLLHLKMLIDFGH